MNGNPQFKLIINADPGCYENEVQLYLNRGWEFHTGTSATTTGAFGGPPQFYCTMVKQPQAIELIQKELLDKNKIVEKPQDLIGSQTVHPLMIPPYGNYCLIQELGTDRFIAMLPEVYDKLMAYVKSVPEQEAVNFLFQTGVRVMISPMEHYPTVEVTDTFNFSHSGLIIIELEF